MDHAGGAWFAVNVMPHKEHAVQRRLRRKGYETLLPEQRVRRRFRRVIVITEAPLFVGYLFVHLDLDLVEWDLVEREFGVSQILKVDGQPWPIGEKEMARVRAHADKKGLVEYRYQQPVRVDAGLFAGHEGRFVDQAPNEEIKILIDILGCDRVVQVPEALVSPAA